MLSNTKQPIIFQGQWVSSSIKNQLLQNIQITMTVNNTFWLFTIAKMGVFISIVQNKNQTFWWNEGSYFNVTLITPSLNT